MYYSRNYSSIRIASVSNIDSRYYSDVTKLQEINGGSEHRYSNSLPGSLFYAYLARWFQDLSVASKRFFYETRIPRNRSQTRQICRIYISKYDMQHDHIQICLPFNPTHILRVCVRREYVLTRCALLHFPLICYATCPCTEIVKFLPFDT